MKHFTEISFDAARCSREIEELGELLRSAESLGERTVIQPFFRERPQLSAFIGAPAPDVVPATRLAYEFPIFGDFTADVVIGNHERKAYCFVELEDASPDQILAKIANKHSKEWARRFEHGFSQLVDWFYSLDDMKKTSRFADSFGYGHVRCVGILVIGRDVGLTAEDLNRLKWRTERVLVNSLNIHCMTFDELYRDLSWRIRHYLQGSKSEPPALS